jgi:hypothetical protein
METIPSQQLSLSQERGAISESSSIAIGKSARLLDMRLINSLVRISTF